MKKRLTAIRKAITKARGLYRLVSWVDVAKEIGISQSALYTYLRGAAPTTRQAGKIEVAEWKWGS